MIILYYEKKSLVKNIKYFTKLHWLFTGSCIVNIAKKIYDIIGT